MQIIILCQSDIFQCQNYFFSPSDLDAHTAVISMFSSHTELPGPDSD